MRVLRIPVSTYRIQFSLSFRFVDGRDLVPYLHELGITDLYSSPRFKARRGSPHAYDIANPLRVNSELGTEAEFAELTQKLTHYSMGLLLDVVPNHMAASRENPWWMDVLENGQASRYASYFDIDWRRTFMKSTWEGKVVLPVLGDLYGNVLENQELILKLDENGFFVQYYEHRLPVNPKSYHRILDDCLERMRASSADPSPDERLKYLLEALEKLPARPGSPEEFEYRHRSKEELKRELWILYRNVAELRNCLDETVRLFNGAKGDPRSFDRLDLLLSDQSYRVAYWRMAGEELNYRRFFDINELVGVRVEDPQVFEAREAEVLGLVGRGMVTGFRVDHIDGLFDPRDYLERLQQGALARLPEQEGADRLYVIVEKILGGSEDLPREWQTSGTTGYGFLGHLNSLFVHPEGLKNLGETYRRFTGIRESFGEVRYTRKKLVMQDLFAAEVNALGSHLGKLAAADRRARDLPFQEMVQALVEVCAWFPVYRTYIRDYEVTERDRGYIEQALEAALRASGSISEEVFAFLRRVLLLEIPHYATDRWAWLHFTMRWQQFTGPVMAKGFEDTACYVYNRLVSQNEVGSDPELADHPVGLEKFHERNRKRLSLRPYSLNATSTHDTKRSEDVRARINVLSELPEEWARRLERWSDLNRSKKTEIDGCPAPDANEEIFLYQNLLGAWPLSEQDQPGFPERMRNYLQKALREAKVHTNWLRPNEAYENAVLGFLDAILAEPEGNEFLKDFLPFQQVVAEAGCGNSLAQALLKITAPGVPDFYQGTELWDLSLVDPDNRRPVDFGSRARLLDDLRRREAEDLPALLEDLRANWKDGRIKLYLTYKSLNFRRSRRELFLDGEYVPLYAEGAVRDRVCAFARCRGDDWALTAVPRWVARYSHGDWGQGVLPLPEGAPRRWQSVLTRENFEAPAGKLALAEVLGRFPVALLSAGPRG